MISLKNVTRCYPNGDSQVYALNEVSLNIAEHEFVVILGPSGAGKSSLLNVMSGLEKCDFGTIKYDSEDISEYSEKQLTEFRRKKVGFIFQAYYLLPDLNVENNIRLGASLAGNNDFSNIVEELEISSLLKRMPYQLSGGQQQRVAIARALAKKPKVLFCDEPTGALDEKTGKQVVDLLQKMQMNNKVTIVMVTHNVGIAEMATNVINMNSGEIKDNYRNENPKKSNEVKWV